MAEKLVDEPFRPTIYTALAEFQANLPRVGKTSTAEVRSEKAKYTYSYADLGSLSPLVLPLLANVGLSWYTRPMLIEEGRFVLRYTLAHISGEHLTGDYPLPDPRSSPQVLGSAITYARRYALCAVTGIAPDDDDDDAAAAAKASKPAGKSQRESGTREPSTQTRESTPEQARQPTAADMRARIAGLGRSKSMTDDQTAEAFYFKMHAKIIEASFAQLVEFEDWFKTYNPDLGANT